MSGSRGEANFVWKCKNCKVKHQSGRGIHEPVLDADDERR